jgi:hypothetical protein
MLFHSISLSGIPTKKRQLESKYELYAIMKKQSLECPYQQGFFTETLQVKWSKLQLLWSHGVYAMPEPHREVQSPCSSACYLISALGNGCSSTHLPLKTQMYCSLPRQHQFLT